MGRRPPIARLASPIEQLQPHYPVVIVGSGYGGAILAARLARAGQRVCVLERGREWVPGEFPDTLPAAVAELQVDTPAGRHGRPTGLYDVRVNPDLSVVVGCGLGGGSLINAGVALRPDPRVFEDPRWPAALRGDRDTLVEVGYRRAEAMLEPRPYPDDGVPLQKFAALAASAAALSARVERVPLAVTLHDRVNAAGVVQSACRGCGDCVSGCNHGAKHTLAMTYLPEARHHGAELYPEVAVERVEREGARWLVHCRLLGAGRENFGAPPLVVSADLVVLAAGALGSTEILLRSRAAGLACSDRLGESFSGNGDVLGFAVGADREIRGLGVGARAADPAAPVGPTITGMIDLRQTPLLDDGLVIQEGAIPGAIGGLVARTLGLGRQVVDRLQTLLVMAHDDAGGRLRLEGDRLRLDWPGVGTQPVFARIDRLLAAAARPLGGRYLPNPLWRRARALVTVHPLGGCPMADDAEHGVVNHTGQVFAGSQGTAVYKTLYVADGSVIPRSLGVNPLLTIAALAERCAARLVRDHAGALQDDRPARRGRATAAGLVPAPWEGAGR